MDLSPSALLAHARSDFGQKAIKYAGVSVVGVVLTAVLLLVFQTIGWSPLVSNIVAVTLSSLPCYFLNRAWVWGKTGKNDFAREVVPFWGFAFAGLVLSSILVWFTSHHTDSKILILGANLTGFGLLWVARFFVLDRLLFGKEKVEGETLLEHLAEDAPFA